MLINIRNVAGNMLFTYPLGMFLLMHLIHASLPALKYSDAKSYDDDNKFMEERSATLDGENVSAEINTKASIRSRTNTFPTVSTLNVNLTRQHEGDIFLANGVTSCDTDICIGLSSGTAFWSAENTNKNDVFYRGKNLNGASLASSSSSPSLAPTLKVKVNMNGESCQCRCLPYLSTYREDLGICVDDIHECSLSPFVSGSSTEKIPFVFLPLKGQIIYPSREIRFPEIRMPVCAVTGAQYLTTNGWTDLRNPVDTNYPFRMFRDEGRTFLQWLGEADLRHKIQGRLIVVHLVCRDMSLKFNATNTPSNTTTAHEYIIKPRNVFTPCVAFRVNGSPVKYTNNVSEVSFQSETSSTLASATDGMSTKEYVVIGVCTLLLVLIYVSSVFLYLHMKKRKNRDPHTRRNSTLDDLTNEINYPKNDQVTFGAPFTRTGSLYSAGSLAPSNEPRSRNSLSSLKDDIGIVKNNPLLQHFPQLSENHSGFSSDISNSASECEMDGGGGGGGPSAGVYYDKKKQMQTNVLVHPQMAGLRMDSLNHSTLHMNNRPNHQVIKDEERLECTSSPSNQETECLPAENVAIIEDLITEEKLETLRALANGNIRKKLYFNPSYFEPHLLAEPPAAALEFLQKIREVIAIAKYKMATKRYQPSLIMIPEEGAARSNTPSLYGSQLQNAKECHGCANNRCSGHVKNCGEKRNSIEKWLQTVHSTENANTNLEYRGNDSSRDSNSTAHTGDVQKCTPPNETFNLPKQLEKSNKHSNFHTANGQKKIARKEVVPPKQKPPQPPLSKSNITNSSPTSSPLTTKSESCRNNSANAIQKESFHNDAPIYQACHIPHQLLQNSISLPITHNKLDNFSVLSKVANIYGYAETGSEIYNNPKFSLQDSPVASQKSRESSYRSKESRKRLEVHEPFLTNPTANLTPHQHYDVVRSLQMEQLCTNPIKDACEPEYSATLPSNGSFHLNIPTPDYDSTMEKKDKDIYNNTQSSGPSVPTPDYSSLSRKSLKQYQPDSPIYRRKSPQYLIVDYETDSLERLEQTKRKNSSQSSSSPSSDVSSQLSPSLSTALPLEEELEITHTVFGDRFIGKTSTSQAKTSAVIAKKGTGPGSGTVETSIVNKAKVARIKYDTPFRGSMTIEVEHEPLSDLERSTDSDQYEPDTLDRKPKKQSFCDISNWPTEGLNRRQEHEVEEAASATSLPNIISVQTSCKIKCSTEVSLQNGADTPYSQYEMKKAPSENNVKTNTAIYQSVLVRQNSDCSCKCGEKTNNVYSESRVLSEKGRLLTLEAKHSRRQRPSEPSTPQLPEVDTSKQCSNKTTIIISTPLGNNLEMKSNSIDVRPETENSLEDSLNFDCTVKDINTFQRSTDSNATPSTKRKNAVSPNLLTQSQSNSANTTLSSKTGNFLRIPPKYLPYSNGEDETLSNHSQCTEITGISETIANSEFDGTIEKTLPSLRNQKANEDENLLNKSSINMEKVQLVNKFMDENYSAIFNTHINGLRSDYSLNKYMIRRKDKTNDDNNLDNDNISNVYADDENIIYDNDNQEIKRIANSNNEECNILKNSFDSDFNRVDNVSLSSRSNRSSSRLSQRTKEMYRNAGVPVGIAYPQRSTSNTSIISNNSTNNNNNNINNNNNNNTSSNNSNNSNVATAPVPTTNIQAVYRCEIEPVQLTHGMQIAMGLKDRPKKAKDLKNAWKKFVSMAAAKFSPTLSPTHLYDKNSSSFLDALNKTENVPIIITNEQQQQQQLQAVSSPSSYLESPASASQNYYEQRFGVGARSLQDIDSGYISTDSAEALKRGYYDRYNYRLITNRERIITVDTIEDNSDNDQASTNYEETVRLETNNEQMNNALDIDVNRCEECTGVENHELIKNDYEEGCVDEQHSRAETSDDNDSNRTLTQSNSTTTTQRRSLYISDEEEPITTTSNGSSETDDEANADDMWESGAESVETHSVLYKNIRKPQQR